MLQKLLIAFCTVFLLSACGSSSDDAPVLPDPPPVDDTDNDDDDDDPNGDDDDDTNGDDDDANGDDYNAMVFDMGDSRWSNNDSEATVEYHTDDDVLVITPDFTMVECPQDWDADALCEYMANHTVDGPLDLRGSHFVFELEISQSILDNGGDPGGIVLQAYAQENAEPWEGEWTCEMETQDIESTTLTYECTMPEDNDALNFAEGGDAGQVGLQVLRGDNENDEGGVNNDIEGTITIKSFVIHVVADDANGDDDDANGDDEDNNIYQADMTDGWRVDGEAVPFDHVEDGVQYSPDAEDQQLVYDLDPMDLTGATFVISYTIDQELLDSGANIQPFAQAESGEWADCWVNNGDHEAGEANEESCEIEGDFDAEGDIKIGIQPKGDDVSGTLTIHSLEIQFAD